MRASDLNCRQELALEEAELGYDALRMLCKKLGWKFRHFISWGDVVVRLEPVSSSPSQQVECRVADDRWSRGAAAGMEIMLKLLSSSRFSAVDMQTGSTFEGTLPASFCCLEELELKMAAICPEFKDARPS